MTESGILTISRVNKQYRTNSLVQQALDDVSLSFQNKEFVAILGPSGSGKTTLLNIIGGLDRYDSGEMSVCEVPTSAYKQRDWDTYRNHTIGFIFQGYNLIPHQTVLANVELAMTLSGVRREERRLRAMEALERVGLAEHAHKKPSQLSGGQMQRVAIARALVNDPQILLADEPTGALDTDTGEQVMALLKEIASDHLVIMVTHNPDLAERYATRIVRLKDGKITEDVQNCGTDAAADNVETAPAQVGTKPQNNQMRPKKTRMSYLTALSLSVSNLLSKKARTILVAFAASIGIIGIALILSLSNGANTYIHQMERESLSQYPIEITTSTFSMEQSMMTFAQLRSETGGEDTGQVTERQMMGSMLASAKINDLATLKRWLDLEDNGMAEYTRGIDYSYGISPQIYLMDDAAAAGYRQVNPDQTMAAFGMSMSESMTSLMAGYGYNEVFQPLPENNSLYMDDYSLLAGHWPAKDTDCVLVLTGTGGIPDMMLYTLGLKNAETLNDQITGVISGTAVDTTLEKRQVYDPEEFLGISFRLLPACDRFAYDSKMGLWTDIAGDEQQMRSKLREADEMQIVGVVKPKENVSFGILMPGIDYPSALLLRLMQQAEDSAVVKAQRNNPEVDVLTGIRFGESAEGNELSLANMFTVHPEHLADAISVRWDEIDSLITDETRLTNLRMVRIIREFSRTGSSETLREILNNLLPLMMNLVDVDESRLSEAISFEMDEARMQEILSARAAALSASLEGNLTKFGYADARIPLRITIYPNDFESKNQVTELLNAYNAAMKKKGRDDLEIVYTDYVKDLMSTVITIIDVITYVLIAFVAISLIVSSIMIGIITYISVLERRREIGILRALGASRRNITQVFNAETFIIGLLAGTFGIGATLLLQIPINRIIQNVAERDGIRAFLPQGAALELILLCIVLTFIGGFIPSRKAAHQDPVAALRSE